MNRSQNIAGLLAAALAWSSTTLAVTVNPQGSGQALIFPYYNVNAGNVALLTVMNQSDRAKAVRVRWSDGMAGQATLGINLYLDAWDTWTAALFLFPGTPDRAAVLTDDNSCTFPPLRRSTTLPQLPDGRRYVRMIAPDNDAKRTREGFIEVIEMGSIKSGSESYSALSMNDGMPRDCGRIEGAWEAGGYWTVDAKRDLSNPVGGLSGALAMVNPAVGTYFAIAPVALEEFRVDPVDRPRGTTASVVLHTAPSIPSTQPSLADALSDPAARVARAHVIADGQALVATYPLPNQAADAVTAVLMASSLVADYDAAPASGATTSFVLSYPTRRLYTDSVNGAVSAPFRDKHLISSPAPKASGVVDYRLFNRESTFYSSLTPPDGCGFLCPPDDSVFVTSTAIEVVALTPQADPLLGSAWNGHLLVSTAQPRFDNGIVELLFNAELQLRTRPSVEGYSFIGLPVLGTRLINYINSNVTPGVLANYSGAVPMNVTAHCEKSDGGSCAP